MGLKQLASLGICLRGFSFEVCTFTCICFDQCVVSIFEFHVASIQSSTKRKSALFHVVCTVMSALSFPYRVGTPRAFINMASLYIYLCGDDTTRVFYISGVVCVKFVNRQAKVGKRSNQQVCL